MRGGVKDFHYLQDTEGRLNHMRINSDVEGCPWDEYI